MDEDQWYALSKSQQSADWQEGFDAAKEQYIPVLMEHLRILADLRAQVEALREPDDFDNVTARWNAALDKVLEMLDGDEARP